MADRGGDVAVADRVLDGGVDEVGKEGDALTLVSKMTRDGGIELYSRSRRSR